MTNNIWRRLQLSIARGVLMLLGADRVQARVLSDEVLPNIDRVEPYGLSYRPHPGAQTYLLFPSGDRSHGIAIVIGDAQYNMEIAEGEVALHDDEGNYVHLQRDGNIEINAANSVTINAGTSVTINAPVTKVTGMATIAQSLAVAGEGGGGSSVTGQFNIIGGISCNAKDIGDTHTHTGVQPGDGETGTVS